MRLSDRAGRLVDAFVEVIEPAVARLSPRERWVAAEEGGHLALYEVRKGRADLVTRLPLAGAPPRRLRRARRGAMELRLDPGSTVSQTLRLPAAARDYLEPMIEHRLDRLTPWRTEDIVYGFAVAGPADAEGVLAVDFVATSRQIADGGIARLQAAGLAPTARGTTGGPLERRLRIDLFRGRRDSARLGLRRGVKVFGILAALVLVPACAAATWFAADAQARLDTLAAAFDQKRAALAAATAGGGAQRQDLALIGAKRPETAVVVLIDRLATAIPQSTVLRELEIGEKDVRIAGTSADAPALIGVLARETTLANARFDAPVTRDDAGRDVFVITAARPGLQPPPAAP